MDTGVDADVARWMREERSKLRFDKARLIRANELTARNVQELVNGRAVAIHIPGFCPRAHAHRAVRGLDTRAAKNWRLGRDKTDMNYLLGTPVQVAEMSQAGLARYFREALPNLRRLRAAFAPYVSPVDRLRLELDELWPHGAHLADSEGKKLFVGVMRVMRREHLLEGVAQQWGACHVDDLALPDKPRNLSANIYLRVPRSGGELSLWNLRPAADNVSNTFFRLLSGSAFKPGVQEIIHETLGPPDHVIRPEPGDLVLLDSGRPHAVRGFSRGDRISIQSFVQVHGPSQPLTLYA
ncbi:2OG-Fe(II) oxygenase [Hyalangium versicolor]|uniref:2OG-Fe(II) oxygenase n=1 Tax=Hyalangium versicolor TaxID=2861190 RepID=UPI001CCFC3D0|nr:2OG-Fe(II) oxygenase [Hyalangium versicolor]